MMTADNPPMIDSNFQTPMEVGRYMVNMVPPGCKDVLEPTPGIGNIVKELNFKGFNVIAPNDFFLLEKRQYDCIVMNPPFSSKSAFLHNAPDGFKEQGMRLGYYFLTECMKLSNNIIALMPWFTISDSDVRLRYLKNFGLKSLTALPRKTFQYARIQTVIMELEKGYHHETIFKVFEFRHFENNNKSYAKSLFPVTTT